MLRFRRGARLGDVAFAAGACVVLVGWNNWVGAREWHRRFYPVVNGVAVLGALGAAVGSGFSLEELGLGRDRVRAGVGAGTAAGVPVICAFGVPVMVPGLRWVLEDRRAAGLGRGELAYQVLVRIPVGTVVWEEVAFRGVLLAALRRVLAEPGATVVGSVVFGLWHVRPTVEVLEVNGVAGGRVARVLGVSGVVAGMTGAGVVLSLLRERSGSLVAPVLLHLASNCTGLVAGVLARYLGARAG